MLAAPLFHACLPFRSMWLEKNVFKALLGLRRGLASQLHGSKWPKNVEKSSLENFLKIIRKFVHVVDMCVQFIPSKDFVIPIKVTKFQVVLILHKKCICPKLPDTEGNLRQH